MGAYGSVIGELVVKAGEENNLLEALAASLNGTFTTLAEALEAAYWDYDEKRRAITYPDGTDKVGYHLEEAITILAPFVENGLLEADTDEFHNHYHVVDGKVKDDNLLDDIWECDNERGQWHMSEANQTALTILLQQIETEPPDSTAAVWQRYTTLRWALLQALEAMGLVQPPPATPA